MDKDEAIERYRRLTYKLAKAVGTLAEIREQMTYVNSQMEWDGMFELNFDTALKELAVVQSAAVVYMLEDEFRRSDIEELRRNADALDQADD